MMNVDNLILVTLKGILATATEKICVMGEIDAQVDLKKLREVYEDLIIFWELDERLIEAFDGRIGMMRLEGAE